MFVLLDYMPLSLEELSTSMTMAIFPTKITRVKAN
jgi:hypothetical protein